MKKVISINFSGRLINIEEDAYTNLQNYMLSLKQYFSKEEGSDEIISDIENRIGEIFSEKQKTNSAINNNDVTEVMNKIGRPEDFLAFEDDDSTSRSANQTSSKEQKQFVQREKLYRDGKDKMLGGVCSGLASYFNIDTVLVRIIFIVLFFSTIGFFGYIILWIALPERSNIKPSVDRRFYRDTEDKMIGGVASGLAKYFGIEVWIPRLIFAAPLIFAILSSFTNSFMHDWYDTDFRFFKFSIGGTTTVVYFLLLWLVPQAVTREEKMAMRGEKLDLETLKNNVADGVKNFASRAQQWGETIEEKSKEFSAQARDFGNQASARTSSVANSAGSKIGSGIGLLFKGFALFIAGVIAFTLFITGISFLLGLGTFWEVKEYIISTNWQYVWLWGTIILLFVPIVSIILWFLRTAFKVKYNVGPVKKVLSLLGVVGFFCALALTFSILKNFRNDNNSNPDVEIAMTQPTGTLKVVSTQPVVNYTGTLPWVSIENEDNFDITKDSLKYTNISIVIEKSTDSLYHTFVKKYSRGKNNAIAEKTAQKIQFDISSSSNLLDIGNHIRVAKNEGFRFQQVQITIKVPAGAKIEFDNSIKDLTSFGFHSTEEVWNNGRRKMKRRYRDYHNTFNYETNATYIMTAEGNLKTSEQINQDKLDANKEATEKQKEADEAIRNAKNVETNANKAAEDTAEKDKKEIEENNRKIEENNRKIEELKKKNKEIQSKEITSIRPEEIGITLSTKNALGFMLLQF